MLETQRYLAIINALPPGVKSHSELPDETGRLELDAYLQSSQPELHEDIHGISRIILDSPEHQDFYDPETNRYVLSPLQLRGMIAAGAIAGAEITLIRIGENLTEAHRLEHMTMTEDDPSRFE